jgi:hypothetical protein
MLQIDHVYEFFNNSVFHKDFELFSFNRGVPQLNQSPNIFTRRQFDQNVFFYDQEPLLRGYTNKIIEEVVDQFHENSQHTIFVTSEHSKLKQELLTKYNFVDLYYFFHGFAALDWYRGYQAVNFNLNVVTDYQKDFITYNRLISGDRSYRIYFVSRLVEEGLLDNGLVSFGVADDNQIEWCDEVADPMSKLPDAIKSHCDYNLANVSKLVIDKHNVPGSASASIPINGIMFGDQDDVVFTTPWPFWHVVTETVFYYDKLHLTEKIFKPIVSKQPFMLLASPGNLAYLKSYGFKTFEGIIDESYDSIQDPWARINAVVTELKKFCGLSESEKLNVIRACEEIVEYNFQHFYTNFKHIISKELISNVRHSLKEIGYDDSTIAYNDIYKVLTN